MVEKLLRKYFAGMPQGLGMVLLHGDAVATKAEEVARRLKLESRQIVFIREAALLHDIGICRVNAPTIGCTGNLPYICHGIAGRDILEGEGLHAHALVCERHIGVGLTADDIRRQKLPLPHRDMSPLTLGERIVAFADLFYSKRPETATLQKSTEEVRQGLRKFSEAKVEIFDAWLREFVPEEAPPPMPAPG